MARFRLHEYENLSRRRNRRNRTAVGPATGRPPATKSSPPPAARPSCRCCGTSARDRWSWTGSTRPWSATRSPRAEPEVVIHQMTAINGVTDLKHFDRDFAATNRLRTEGTDHLLAAARATGVRRVIAQSFTGWPNVRTGSAVKTEDDPLDPNPPAQQREILAGDQVPRAARPGGADSSRWCCATASFYGRGVSQELFDLIRKRQMPIVGDGARRLVVDPPRRRGLGHRRRTRPRQRRLQHRRRRPDARPRLASRARRDARRQAAAARAGLAGAAAGRRGRRLDADRRCRGSSNAKAQRELGWTPRWASWRDGCATTSRPRCGQDDAAWPTSTRSCVRCCSRSRTACWQRGRRRRRRAGGVPALPRADDRGRVTEGLPVGGHDPAVHRPPALGPGAARDLRRRVAARTAAHRRGRPGPDGRGHRLAVDGVPARARAAFPCRTRGVPAARRVRLRLRARSPASSSGSPDNCRQIGVRARRHVSEHAPRFESSRAERDELAQRFLAAFSEGDVDGLAALLAADVVVQGDGGGHQPSWPNAIAGRDKVVRLLVGLAEAIAPPGAVGSVPPR